MTWKIVDHTADAGFEVTADSLEELFLQAREAFYYLCLEKTFPEKALEGSGKKYVVKIEALDLEELAVSWINELLFLLERDCSIFMPEKLAITRKSDITLEAKGILLPLGFARISVKAATYGGLEIREFPSAFLRIFLDM